MDLFPMASILAREGVVSQARSALPDAPVVPDRTPRTRAVVPHRPVAATPRRALAAALTRAARAVSPA